MWAAGNGGENEDDCSADGYVSHWDIISIGSINHRGLKPFFMETCPSTMAVVYSGGQTNAAGDDDDPGVRVIASDVRLMICYYCFWFCFTGNSIIIYMSYN